MAIPLVINRSKIVTNIATLISGSVVAQGMTAMALLLTARQLEVDGYGQYAACITVTSLLSIVFSLGLDIWLLREGGRTPSKIAEIAGSVLSIKAAVGFIWLLVLWFLAPLFDQQSFPILLLRISLILIWFDSLLATGFTTFKAALVSKTPSIIEASADSIWFGLTIVLMWVVLKRPEIYLAVRVFISLLALFSTLILLKRRFGLRYDESILVRAIKESLPFTVSEFLAMITMRADVVIISFTLGKTATGLYSPVVGIVNMAFLVPLAVHIVMVPVLSNLYQNNPEQAKITARRAIVLSIFLGILLAILFTLGSPLIIYLLGRSYTDSIAVLKILSWLLPFKCGSYALAAILIATEKQIKRTTIQGIAAVINISLNLIVVYQFGIKGIASVYVITEIVLFLGYSWFAMRKQPEEN